MRLRSDAPSIRGGRLARAIAAALPLVALSALPAAASDLPIRTERVSQTRDGQPADGASDSAVISPSGRVLAFNTFATNLADGDTNGPLSDVVLIDLATNQRRLVTAGGNGPSYRPTISNSGARVVFASEATNLVPGDTNGVTDLFLRDGGNPIIRMTVNAQGQQANGASYQADLTADGQKVVFASDASNLVAGDTNGTGDVFVQDLRTGEITRVSVSSSGQQGNGRSLQPSISADGRYVVFDSSASNLVAHDTNGLPDVFVADLTKHTVERVSVSSTGHQQNRAVSSPFTQIPDISADGRYVVFDSDATNLYPQDTNSHTDVFLRDRLTKVTTLISASSLNVEGNNDSFAPRMTPNGRFVSFQSIATNLAPGDGPREDIFLRDLRQGTTSLVNVTADGTPRGPELVSQLLQRPAISDDGKTAAFTSTVANLTPGDTNGLEDVFVRLMEPPAIRIVDGPTVADGKVRTQVDVDDPSAREFVCQVDAQTPFKCSADVTVRKNQGRKLRIRAGGLGTLFSDPVVVTLSHDQTGPRVRISKLRRSSRYVRGRASDASGVARVEVSVVSFIKGQQCRYLVRPGVSRRIACYLYKQAPFVKATGRNAWRIRLANNMHGAVVIRARGIDGLGNTSKPRQTGGVAG